MVVDIGGGTTDVAVLSMNGVASSASIRVAGNAFDEAIGRYMRGRRRLMIGKTTAEDIKIQIGSVFPMPEDVALSVKGRDAQTGMAKEVTIQASEIREVLMRPARQIADQVIAVLEEASAELLGDIAAKGILLTGGGSQMLGMDRFLTEHTGIRCTVADDPDSCVAYGCGKSLRWINHMKEGPINIARKRMMRE